MGARIVIHRYRYSNSSSKREGGRKKDCIAYMKRKKAVGERLRLKSLLPPPPPPPAPLAEDFLRSAGLATSTVFSTTCASSVILILLSRLQLCMSMRTTGTSLLQASLHGLGWSGMFSSEMEKMKERRQRQQQQAGRQVKLPSGEGASVPGALEDGGLDTLPAARGVAAGLSSRHGWMLNLLGDLVAWAGRRLRIRFAIAVQAGRGDRSNKGRGGGGKGFGGARARGGSRNHK